MSHTTAYNSATHIIETKFHGEIAFEEIRQVMVEVTAIAVQKNCFSWLNDFSDAGADLTSTDVYNLSKALPDIASPLGNNIDKIKRAIVTGEKIKNVQFAETVAVNRGQHVKVFDDIIEARRWLSGI
jgi:hypothetical protein